MKHCGVVTDIDVFWDYVKWDETGSLKETQEAYYELFYGRHLKRIYSDEVPMADEINLNSIKYPLPITHDNNGNPIKRKIDFPK